MASPSTHEVTFFSASIGPSMSFKCGSDKWWLNNWPKIPFFFFYYQLFFGFRYKQNNASACALALREFLVRHFRNLGSAMKRWMGLDFMRFPNLNQEQRPKDNSTYWNAIQFACSPSISLKTQTQFKYSPANWIGWLAWSLHKNYKCPEVSIEVLHFQIQIYPRNWFGRPSTTRLKQLV